MDHWLKIDNDLSVNLAQITHVTWADDGSCALWLNLMADDGAEPMQDLIVIDDPKTAQVLRAYLHAHGDCLWCWAEKNLEQGKTIQREHEVLH